MVRNNSCCHNLKNGINEKRLRRHKCDNPGNSIYKMKGMTLEEVASIAGWTHSMNASTAGHEPFKLLTVSVIKLVIL